jgi:hypothetical protein
MWQTKLFKTKETFDKWIEQNKNKVQYTEIFVNNYYKGVEFKPLVKIL